MNKIYPLKQALITALISAVFATGAFMIIDGLNQHNGWRANPATIRGLVGLLTLVILGIGLYMGMLSIKRANAGKISYGQAVVVGILIALTVGVVMSVVGIFYTKVINPGYADYVVTEGKKALIADNKSPADIAQGVAGLQKQFTASAQAMQALVGQTVAGTVISLVMALFIRTKK